MEQNLDLDTEIETPFCRKKNVQNREERSRRTMGRGTASSGRCRPQTLQRFLSLGFNSMLPACHSDLRSVPVIRTAFKAGPKQQSCSRGGSWRGRGVGGDGERWRGTWADKVDFQIDTEALHFHIHAHSFTADRRGRWRGRESLYFWTVFFLILPTSFS